MKSRHILLSFLALTASFVGQAKELIILNDMPQWFVDDYKRETAVHATSELEIKGLGVKDTVKGKWVLADTSDGTWYYNIDIGTESPMECYVFTSFDGAANSLHSIIEHSVQGAANLNNKPLTGQFNMAISSGVVGRTPYLGFDKLYHVGEGSGKLAGVIKGLSAKTNDTLQICIHNQIGYRDTFLTVFETFINAFNNAHTNNAFFQPVYRLNLNGTPVGYAKEVYSKDAEGDIGIYTEFSMLLPVDGTAVSRSDAIETSWSRPDGSLINANEFSVENGELSSNVALVQRDNIWQVEGEKQGKQISGRLNHDDVLYSSYGHYTQSIQLKRSEQKQSEFYMWVPDVAPTEAVKVSVSKLENDPINNMKFVMGPMAIKMRADDFGMFLNATLSQGPINIDMELLYVEGTPESL